MTTHDGAAAQPPGEGGPEPEPWSWWPEADGATQPTQSSSHRASAREAQPKRWSWWPEADGATQPAQSPSHPRRAPEAKQEAPLLRRREHREPHPESWYRRPEDNGSQPQQGVKAQRTKVEGAEERTSRRWLPVWEPEESRSGPNHAGSILMIMCTGVLVVCLSFWAGRGGHTGADAMYWAGQALLLLPPLVRIVAIKTPTAERVTLLMAVAGLQSFLKWAYSPDQFRFPDELQHLRTLQDVLSTDHLYTTNSYLPVSPGYPGLEVATAAVHDLSGISVIYAGVLVVLVCHMIVPVAVLGLVNELTGSARTAAIAAAIYGTAPHQPYFNTLFVYGAVALPFMVLSIWAAVRSRRPGTSALAVLPPFLITMVSHHVTVAVTLALLAACVFVLTLARVGWSRITKLFLVSILAGCAAVAWTATRAAETFAYLDGPLRSIMGSLRSAGGGSGVAPSPLKSQWESLVSMGAAGMTLVLIALGVVALWRARSSVVVRVLSVLGGSYAIVMAIRVVTSDGPEFSARLLTFVMVLVALPAAAAIIWISQWGRLGALSAFLTMSLLAAGSITSGLPPSWERVPRGFRIAASESGVDQSVLAVGHWASQATRRHSRAACDLSICSVVASYGRATASANASEVYYGSARELPAQLGRLSLDYVYVDRRMTEQLPVTGSYFWADVRAGQHDIPFDPKLLRKFDKVRGIDRVYDNGYVQTYYTRRAWS
jgi:hypothetical protein